MALTTTIGREPARIDIDAVCGEPVDFTVPVLDATGAAEDLAGWTLLGQIHVGETVLYTFTTEEAASDGGVTVTAPGADTEAWADWSVPSARWSLWFTPPASQPYLFAAGWVRVSTH